MYTLDKLNFKPLRSKNKIEQKQISEHYILVLTCEETSNKQENRLLIETKNISK